jgi:predicted peptidase
MRFFHLLCLIFLLISGCSPGQTPTEVEPGVLGSPEATLSPPTSPEVTAAQQTPFLPTDTDVPVVSPTVTSTATEPIPTPISPFSPEFIAPGQDVAFSFLSTSGEEILYWLYLPKDYDPAQEWPILISLHGFLGFDASLDKVKNQYPPAFFDPEIDFPFIVIAPLAPSGSWAKYHQPMEELITNLGQHLSIDTDAQFLTGLSAGTVGVWQWALAYPERFQGVSSIAGGTAMNPDDSAIENFCLLKDLPVWVAHSEADNHVPIEASLVAVAALEDCGSTVVSFTTYTELNHSDSIRRAFSSPELYDWMLALSN